MGSQMRLRMTVGLLLGASICFPGSSWAATAHSLDAADGAPVDAVFVDNDGHVGIGTTNPNGKLTVSGAGGSVADGMEWFSTGNANGYSGWAGRIYVDTPTGSWATAPFVFTVPNTSGGEMKTMTLLNGNVGIGTTTPSTKLEVFDGDLKLQSAASFSGRSLTVSDNVASRGHIGAIQVGTGEGIGGMALTLQSHGNLNLGIAHGTGDPNGAVTFFTNPGAGVVETMRITRAGNVGIGTTAPLAKLDVAGPIRANNHLTHLSWFNLGQAPQGPWVPGYMKLVTPIVQNESNMFTIKIKGYRYGSGGTAVEIQCGGYAYGSGGLISTDCHTEGTADPVGIGVENNVVIITIGSGAGAWYYDHFTAEYSGWQGKRPEDFVWQFVYNAPPSTVDQNRVYVDDSSGLITTSGNIGVGASPNAGVHINQAGPWGSLVIQNQYAGAITHFDYPDGKNYIRGTTLIADQGGNVGIGTPPASAAKLHVAGMTYTTRLMAGGAEGTSADQGYYDIGANRIGVNTSLYSYGKICAGNTSGDCNGTGGAVLSGGTSYFTGNVGIGIQSPDATTKLHVVGHAKIVGDLDVTGNLAAKYQDVAEWVVASRAMTAGTVAILDAAHIDRVQPSLGAYDTRVAGVVSAQPGLLLGEPSAEKVKVATTGRVKVRATTTNGPIAIGDLLVTSDAEGTAMRSAPLDFQGTPLHRPGTILGKALEPLPEGEGEILVLLTLQ